MKKIFSVLFHPIVWAVLGLLLLSLLIWFVGPLVLIGQWAPLQSVTSRLVLIGVIVLIWILVRVYRSWQASRANARLMDGLAGRGSRGKDTPEAEAAPVAGASEVKALNERFTQAIATLREMKVNTPGGGGLSNLLSLTGKQYLYQLPWYVFIGAPGSGKTTALLNSGLQFPLAEKLGTASIRGVGGTRNCDWWFTDEAVMLDTAGRYTTQDSDSAADKAAWQSFLDLLRKNRPRQPLNGIVLTVGVADLLTQSPARRADHAAALRARIQELNDKLGVRIPIYVLVTKCDLLSGFTEYFLPLGKEERAQVWGMTFPYEEKTSTGFPLQKFTEEFRLLNQRVTAGLVGRMAPEKDPTKQVAVFTFPQEFGTFGPLLGDFLDSVFLASKYAQAPLVRGVYFTSGTQEGSPIDRIMGTLSRAFGVERGVVPPKSGAGRSYFLTKLLKDVMFGEAGLAGANQAWDRRRKLLRRAAAACIAVAAIGIAAAWGVSYTRNSAYLKDVDNNVSEFRKALGDRPIPVTADPTPVIPFLQRVRTLSKTEANNDAKPPLSMTWGLYQGDKMDAASKLAYERFLVDVFQPRIVTRLSEQMMSANKDNLEFAYESLKAYLMLYQPEHFDADALKAWITLDWDRNQVRNASAESRKALDTSLDDLLALGPQRASTAMDEALVGRVRLLLNSYPLEQRIYSRLKRQGLGDKFPDFTVAKAGGPQSGLVFQRASGKPLTEGVKGLFTFDGYYKGFRNQVDVVAQMLAIEEPWVLGQNRDLADKIKDLSKLTQLGDRVRILYLQDYANEWQAFLQDVKVVPIDSLDKSIQLARALSAPDSPLAEFLRAASRETTLVRTEAEKSVIDKAGDAVSNTRKSLESLFGTADKPAVLTQGKQIESIVDNRFETLRRLVKASASGEPPPINAMLKMFDDIYVYLTAVDSAVKSRGPLPPPENAARLKADAARLPEPARGMLETLSGGGQQLSRSAERTNLSQDVAPLTQQCQTLIGGRYPLVAGARDALPEDFGQVFGAGGILDDFFQKRLAAQVDTSGPTWRFKPSPDGTPAGNAEALVAFQKAARIRDVFFRGGGKVPGLRLDFKPVEMDASIQQFILDFDGQLVKYSHGPIVPVTVQWPGQKGSGQVRVQLLPPAASGSSGLVFEGPWALFRMFDAIIVEPTPQPERFLATFSVGGRNAKFEVTTSSVQNPFRLRELKEFSCPNRF